MTADKQDDENFCPDCIARMDPSIEVCPNCEGPVFPYKKRITRLADYQKLINLDDTPAPQSRIKHTF